MILRNSKQMWEYLEAKSNKQSSNGDNINTTKIQSYINNLKNTLVPLTLTHNLPKYGIVPQLLIT